MQFIEQYEGWKKRSLFEKMWVLRDFNKHAGMSADQWLNLLNNLQNICDKGDYSALLKKEIPINKLVQYINHLQDLAKGYVKDKDELKKSLEYLQKWQKDTESLEEYISKIR